MTEGTLPIPDRGVDNLLLKCLGLGGMTSVAQAGPFTQEGQRLITSQPVTTTATALSKRRVDHLPDHTFPVRGMGIVTGKTVGLIHRHVFMADLDLPAGNIVAGNTQVVSLSQQQGGSP